MNNLNYSKFEMRSYLKPEAKLTKLITNFSMQARSRMIPTKENFKTSFQNTNMDCRGCLKEPETQQHLLDCEALNENSISTGVQEIYDNLFSDDPIKISNIASKLTKLVNSRPSACSDSNITV